MIKSHVNLDNENLEYEDLHTIQLEYIYKVKDLLSERYKDKDLPLAYVHSYGCQQNISDTEKLKGSLALMGYGFTENVDYADFILYNTCAIRENAEDRVFGSVGTLKRQKRRNPNLIIVLCGCMMQQSHVVERIKNVYPHVSIVFGTDLLHKLPEFMFDYLSKEKRVFCISDLNTPIVEGQPIKRDGDIKAWVPIMYGCNKFCTYCIVPYVRGRERSRSIDSVLEEVQDVVNKGYKEITLLGQNVNSYGLGLEGNINFSELLKRINDIKGDFRVRFMSPHPKDATVEMFDTIANCEKICNHVHLPVQSGSDRILKLMNRKYSVEKYLELIEYGKSKIKGISFTSDIIVGFPGETYEEFLQTVELIKKVRYNSLFTFIYSKRVGTRAAEMDDPIPYAEKSKWLRELLAVQQEIGDECHSKLVGTRQRVLVDGIGKYDEGYLTGRTESNIITDFKSENKNLIGQFVEVEIIDSLRWAILGKLIV